MLTLNEALQAYNRTFPPQASVLERKFSSVNRRTCRACVTEASGASGRVGNVETVAVVGGSIAGSRSIGVGGTIGGGIGGAIDNRGTMSIDGTSLTNNQAPAWGGAVFNDGGSA